MKRYLIALLAAGAVGVLVSPGVYGYQAEWALLHATSSQRAEAFLRTIGKWKD